MTNDQKPPRLDLQIVLAAAALVMSIINTWSNYSGEVEKSIAQTQRDIQIIKCRLRMLSDCK